MRSAGTCSEPQGWRKDTRIVPDKPLFSNAPEFCTCVGSLPPPLGLNGSRFQTRALFHWAQSTTEFMDWKETLCEAKHLSRTVTRDGKSNADQSLWMLLFFFQTPEISKILSQTETQQARILLWPRSKEGRVDTAFSQQGTSKPQKGWAEKGPNCKLTAWGAESNKQEQSLWQNFNQESEDATCQWQMLGKISPLYPVVLGKLFIHIQKNVYYRRMNLYPYLSPFTKIKLKWIGDLDIKIQTLICWKKILKKKKNLEGRNISKDLLNQTPVCTRNNIMN